MQVLPSSPIPVRPISIFIPFTLSPPLVSGLLSVELDSRPSHRPVLTQSKHKHTQCSAVHGKANLKYYVLAE
ncbi:hypothetical protein F5144DRAFT_557515 [Chaetomium tenue]|uniref:Uncharacterized protein n=1 Tax=Chaetomium tenue TaxID=1854479 RepID=A0ACB7PSH6_9PEZI|nr:hypothetical protein F5144DRAFT_557515 [Chaetomium globosum]